MDSITELTTANFRDGRPGSVWVVETWESLNKIKFKRVSSELQTCRITHGKAVIILQTRISTLVGYADQRDVYFLVRENGLWKIDDLKVTDEEVDVKKLLL
ncbi:hypothetical protein QUF72_21575 [Desulfobacterales bacterium HSG2]|nr:hypothetical protein [Desulfobacterales bacterium HSG2]